MISTGTIVLGRLTWFSLWVFGVSVLVHFMWEMLVSFAYRMEGIALDTVVFNHLMATLGDGGLMLLLYWAPAALRRNPGWIARIRWSDAAVVAALGVVLSVLIEWRALGTGRWSYTELMPILPVIEVGALPVLQLILLPFPIFWAAARLAAPGRAAVASTPADPP